MKKLSATLMTAIMIVSGTCAQGVNAMFNPTQHRAHTQADVTLEFETFKRNYQMHHKFFVHDLPELYIRLDDEQKKEFDQLRTQYLQSLSPDELTLVKPVSESFDNALKTDQKIRERFHKAASNKDAIIASWYVHMPPTLVDQTTTSEEKATEGTGLLSQEAIEHLSAVFDEHTKTPKAPCKPLAQDPETLKRLFGNNYTIKYSH